MEHTLVVTLLGILLSLFVVVVVILYKNHFRKPPYRRGKLMSAPEVQLYRLLEHMVPNTCYLFAKPRLIDLLYIPGNDKRMITYKKKVWAKHVDMVIVDKQTFIPILAIELDDASHQLRSRRERDRFVDSVMKQAGIPILHVPQRERYDFEELKKQILDGMKQTV